MLTELSGIFADLDEQVYHSRPELSSTGARLLLPEYKGSPKKFQWAQTHRRESRTFDVGKAAHTKILGVGSGTTIYPDEHLTPSGAVSTKAATIAWEAEMRGMGLTPVSPREAHSVDAMAEAVLAHPTAGPILEWASGREVSVFATVDDVPVRARFDALSPDGVAVDLKTCDDATKNGFEKSVSKWGYDVQEAFYDDVYEAATGLPLGIFYFLAVEKSAPYEVAVHRLPEIWSEMGRVKAAEARRIYKECIHTGVWPGYDEAVTFLDPPAWLLYEHENRYEEEIRI